MWKKSMGKIIAKKKQSNDKKIFCILNDQKNVSVENGTLALTN